MQPEQAPVTSSESTGYTATKYMMIRNEDEGCIWNDILACLELEAPGVCIGDGGVAEVVRGWLNVSSVVVWRLPVRYVSYIADLSFTSVSTWCVSFPVSFPRISSNLFVLIYLYTNVAYTFI